MQQTFNQAALMKSFPDSTEAPWTLIERFGPTLSGAEGFNVIIPGELWVKRYHGGKELGNSRFFEKN